MARPKVAVLAPCPFFIDRGTPIRIKRLATAAAAEFDVHVISFHLGRDGSFPFKIHRTLSLPLQINRSGANFTKLVCDPLLFFKALAVIRREKIRVIDGHLHEGAFIGILLRFFTGAAVIYNCHGTFTQELIATGVVAADSWLVKPLTWFENWIEKSVDMIAAQSRLRQDEFRAKGLSIEKIALIEDVPELEDLCLRPEQIDRVLEQRLRPNGEKLLIYSGGMEKYQGVDFLLEAFREICRKRHDVRLVLFGRPLAEYRVMAERLGVASRVDFVDDEPFERLAQYLAICDIGFALRLYGENVPGKLPIYMASGIAVVGTDTKGINTVITDRVTGRLVPPEDVDTLVGVVNELLAAPQVVAELGAAGRAEALKRYSQEDVTRELSRVYHKLLAKGKR